ncbi:LysM domain-containing protein [Granulicella sp. dw_53]|uniref:LysM domain-containing protein n=1 Tax=Granulicella sp. dw_53 TaxID=2719792 RepID=UPI0021061117|nr:LysM domain-containing protein [Granulicella sp. dw_53]
MEAALASIVKSAAGTGAPTNPSSRYYGSPVLTLTLPNGTEVAYLQRRILPQPDVYTSIIEHNVVEGDRLDVLAARYLGDPLLFWMICDVNAATDPEQLTAQTGRTIKIPLASGIPAGARNG